MTNPTKRLRVFAGPNGSGKSTVIDAIRREKIDDRTIDFGIYINADEIAAKLRSGSFEFSSFQLPPISHQDFVAMALATGLVNDTNFSEADFRSSFRLNALGQFILHEPRWHENLAQIMATVIRERLLIAGSKISFETVFSHESKLDYMRRAKEAGYKIYLYFIAT
ncbi:MAG: hypothetical protein A3H44_08625 [Gammaproteobacteria bacterium RIFCSPLOWO2_02_FULL_57_10]|nr:MAG: hypothetical protein A3H44_08625 [Gammaproteobacteria bacterium RIFCSPLOWO2_02_FULL_57_10]